MNFSTNAGATSKYNRWTNLKVKMLRRSRAREIHPIADPSQAGSISVRKFQNLITQRETRFEPSTAKLKIPSIEEAEVPCKSHFKLLLESDIAFVFHERGMPWHIPLVGRQLCIEVGMCVAVNGLSLERAVAVALIGIEESGASQKLKEDEVLNFGGRGECSPEALGRVQRVGEADPVRRGRLAHA